MGLVDKREGIQGRGYGVIDSTETRTATKLGLTNLALWAVVRERPRALCRGQVRRPVDQTKAGVFKTFFGSDPLQ